MVVAPPTAARPGRNSWKLIQEIHTGCRADAGECSDSKNPNPGSSSCPSGIPVALLTLEQLMEMVGAHVKEEMLQLFATHYQLPQTQTTTPYQPPQIQAATPYQSFLMQLSSPNQQFAVGQSPSVLPSQYNNPLAELMDNNG